MATQRNIIHSSSKSWKPRGFGGAPRKLCRGLKWEGSVFIIFLIQKRERASKAAWPGAKRRWLCGYPEGFFLLLEKSERRFRETGWCAQEDQWIWEVHWWHMLGLDINGSFSGSDSRREGKSQQSVVCPGVCTGKQSTRPSKKRQHQGLDWLRSQP